MRIDFSGDLAPEGVLEPVDTGAPLRIDFAGTLAPAVTAPPTVDTGDALRIDFSGQLEPNEGDDAMSEDVDEEQEEEAIVRAVNYEGRCASLGTDITLTGSGFGDPDDLQLFVMAARSDAKIPVRTHTWTDAKIIGIIPTAREIRADGRTPHVLVLTDLDGTVVAEPKTTFTICR